MLLDSGNQGVDSVDTEARVEWGGVGVQWGGGMVNVRTTVRRTCCFWAKTCAAHETPCTPCLW